jgi:hypothetical protein
MYTGLPVSVDLATNAAHIEDADDQPWLQIINHSNTWLKTWGQFFYQ